MDVLASDFSLGGIQKQKQESMESEIFINKHGRKILYVWYSGDDYKQTVNKAYVEHGLDPDQVRYVATPEIWEKKCR